MFQGEKLRQELESKSTNKELTSFQRAGISRAISIIDRSIQLGISLDAFLLMQLGICLEQDVMIDKRISDLCRNGGSDNSINQSNQN